MSTDEAIPVSNLRPAGADAICDNCGYYPEDCRCVPDAVDLARVLYACSTDEAGALLGTDAWDRDDADGATRALWLAYADRVARALGR